jgi:hypothetical protein
VPATPPEQPARQAGWTARWLGASGPPRLARWRGALVLATAAAGALACLVPLRDPDAFHLMAFGRVIVRGGGLPATEPFVWPWQGVASGAPSWLTSVLLFLSTEVGGLTGPPVLAAILAGVTVAVLAVDATDEVAEPGAGGAPAGWPGLLVALAPLAAAVALLRMRAAPRPELVAWIGVALVALAVRRLDRGRRGLLLAVPAVLLVWTNAHQSAALGVALLGLAAGAAAARAVFTRRDARDWRPARWLALATLAAVLAALANPAGAAPLLVSVRFVLLPLGLDAPALAGAAPDALAWVGRVVTELQPLTLADWLGPLGLLAALTLAGAAVGFRRSTPRDLLLAAAGVALALSARRHVGFAAVLLSPVAGRHLARGVARLPARPAWRLAAAVAGLAGAAAGVALLLTGPEAGFGVAFPAGAHPVRATAYLSQLGFRGRLFNRFQTGGYLEWMLGVPVFQDGRGLLKPEDAGAALMEAGHLGAFEQLDRRYRFDALLLGRPELTEPMVALSQRLGPGRDLVADRARWALVAFDDGGLLYLRRDGTYAAAAARDEYRLAMPANPLVPDRFDDPALQAGLLADHRRAVAEAPWCRTCRIQLGWGLSRAGRAGEVAAAVTPALGGPRDTESLALQLLAMSAAARGDRAEARRRYREVLRLGAGDDRITRRNLVLLALADGDLGEAAELVEQNLAADPRSAADLALRRQVEAARAAPAR